MISRKSAQPARVIQCQMGHVSPSKILTLLAATGEEEPLTLHKYAVSLARMGRNTWAALVGTDADAMVAGDLAMLESEVGPQAECCQRGETDGPPIRNTLPGSARRLGRLAAPRRSRRRRKNYQR